MEILSQKTMPWGNMLIGSSNYYIHAVGCFVTVIAEILGVTPDVVNDRLKAVNGFAPDKDGQLDEVIWEKMGEAFSGWSVSYFTPYDNAAVLAALQEGKSVLVQVDAAPIGNPGGLHAVRYMGGGKLHDPWTGTERPTSDFPGVKAFNIFTPTVTSEPVEATPVPVTTEVVPTIEDNPGEPEAPPAPIANTEKVHTHLIHIDALLTEIKSLLGIG